MALAFLVGRWNNVCDARVAFMPQYASEGLSWRAYGRGLRGAGCLESLNVVVEVFVKLAPVVYIHGGREL